MGKTVTKPDLTAEQNKLLEYKGEGFDFRTHIRDPKTGELIREQPYTLIVSKDNGTVVVRDGKRYTTQGQLVNPEKPAVK